MSTYYAEVFHFLILTLSSLSPYEVGINIPVLHKGTQRHRDRVYCSWLHSPCLAELGLGISLLDTNSSLFSHLI